ncbi:MAG: polysaccharide deacetylase [Acetivibrionales bacterium]|jgi:peptidoglycan/xylan/chitin deacetylase (PgdA/CDA1 family)
MRKRKLNVKRLITILTFCSIIIASAAIIAFNGNKSNIAKEDTSPTPTAAPTSVPTPQPQESGTTTPSASPEQPEEEPDSNLIIRTDYEDFLPNESGQIPIVMFHRFIEAYEENTEKEYTTTFSEFEDLLQTLYDGGYRLISMDDFIECNISVPAGTMPMVFTFDDGTAGQFNLIEEDGYLKINPKSAVGIMVAFNEKHPDFGLKGIFYVNMDIGDNTFKGEGTLKERFDTLLNLGFELGTHTWGHVNFSKPENYGKITEAIGRNQQKAEEILPGFRFYSLALPHGGRPSDKSLWPLLQSGTYNNIDYYNDTIMAVGANPTVPSISKDYNSLYVARIRAQGRVKVDADLTWWLPRMTSTRMFISDGDPSTIIVPEEKAGTINADKLGGKRLITY